jgi:hypothetical protein
VAPAEAPCPETESSPHAWRAGCSGERASLVRLAALNRLLSPSKTARTILAALASGVRAHSDIAASVPNDERRISSSTRSFAFNKLPPLDLRSPILALSGKTVFYRFLGNAEDLGNLVLAIALRLQVKHRPSSVILDKRVQAPHCSVADLRDICRVDQASRLEKPC